MKEGIAESMKAGPALAVLARAAGLSAAEPQPATPGKPQTVYILRGDRMRAVFALLLALPLCALRATP